tara:strand:- start:107 stop:211 length:105 start_codon:yes stop_codon:yes gene_type:complete
MRGGEERQWSKICDILAGDGLTAGKEIGSELEGE